MKYRVWLSVLCIVCMLAGCSTLLQGQSTSKGNGEGTQTLGLTPDFSYEVKQQVPNILINQVGYPSQESKVAIMHGNDLQPEFWVYNAMSHKQEYKGSLQSGRIEMETTEENAPEGEEKKNIYLADFSEINKPGSYYLYHPDLGYSYTFRIAPGIYDDIEKTVLYAIENEENDTSLICYQLSALLITKELYPKNVLEQERLDTLCKEKIERLLLAQDPVTGSIYDNISDVYKIRDLDATQKQAYVSLAATAEFAGTMAMYAYQMRDLDWETYYKCMTAAETAYRTIQNSLDNVGYDAGYFAATSLYRLTGRAKYSQAINLYLTMKEEQKSYTEYDFTLFADYIYLTLRYGANLNLSEMVMKKIMSQAEEISLLGGKNNYYVSTKRDYNDIDGKLRDMANLALVNYIITNHEYTTLQKNYLDYFLGRNPQNICYVDGFGTLNAVDESKKINAKNSGLFYLLLQSTKMEIKE